MKKLTVIILSTMFSCAAFAQGFYMEMAMSSTGKGAMGTVKVYSQDGNSRSEINMTTQMGAMNMVTLILKSEPNTLYMLNDKNQTYSTMDLDKNNQYKDFPEEDYEVTVLGKEKVNGYNTMHVKVMRKGAQEPEEMWTSKEVVDYSAFISAKTKFTGRNNLNKALAAKGAEGFPVRIKTTEHGTEIQMDLVKAEKRNQPATLFSLDGYTKSATKTVGGQSQQEMMQKLQNMTPEERQKYIEEMRKQYGK